MIVTSMVFGSQSPRIDGAPEAHVHLREEVPQLAEHLRGMAIQLEEGAAEDRRGEEERLLT